MTQPLTVPEIADRLLARQLRKDARGLHKLAEGYADIGDLYNARHTRNQALELERRAKELTR